MKLRHTIVVTGDVVRLGLFVAAVVLALGARAEAAETHWTGAEGSELPWYETANWTAGVPVTSNHAYISNGGTATIGAGDTANAETVQLGASWVANNLGGTIIQSGGVLRTIMGTSISAGHSPSGLSNSATYLLSDGLLAGMLTIRGTGTNLFRQTGGTVSSNSIMLIATGDTSRYELSNGLVSTPEILIGGGGSNLFRQTGGQVVSSATAAGLADSSITVGQGSAAPGRYELHGPGELTTSRLTVDSGSTFDQTDGTVAANWLLVSGSYRFVGGTLTASRGWTLSGTMDFGGAAKSVAVGNAVVDLSRGTVINGIAASFTSGPNSLVIVGPTFNSTMFGGGWNPGNLVHIKGTPLVVGAGQGFGGWGNIDDHVTCAGAIDAGLVADGSSCGLNLTNGVNVNTGGSVDLRGGTLKVRDTTSGLTSGGTLTARNEYIGTSAGAGTFTQTGGTNTPTYFLCLGYKDGTTTAGRGTYYLSGAGVLNAMNLTIGLGGKGRFVQSGGANTIAGSFTIGNGVEGVYELSGGTLTANGTYGTNIEGGTGSASFVHTGGVHNANAMTIGGTGSAGGNPASYTLSGTGELNVTRWERVSGYRNTTFTQNGGVHTVTGTLGNLTVGGRNAAYSSLYELNGGTLSVGSVLSIGGKGTSTFTQTGGACAVTGDLRVAADYDNGDNYKSGLVGTVNLRGGTFTAAVQKVGHYGIGAFNHTAGSNTVLGTLFLGDDSRGTGTYSLSGATSTVSCGSLTVADEGRGTFGQNSGAVDVAGLFLVGKSASGTGTYALSGAASQLSTADLVVGDAGKGTFIHSSGSALLPGGMVIGKSATGDGVYQYSSTGNELSTPRLVVGDAGKGAFTQSSGTISIADGITLGYGETGDGTYHLDGGTLSTSDLIVGRDDGDSHGTGAFVVNNAASSITISSSMHIGLNGSLQAVEGTVIHMTGSHFSNASINPAAVAGMSNLTLIFEGGPSHIDIFEVAGRDFGVDIFGLEENFALHTLSIGGSQIGKLRLVDLVDNQPDWQGAESLYVENLILTQGSMLELGKLNLYYGTLTDQGGTVLSNGGSLQEIPEPATFAVLAAGMAILISRRRRRQSASALKAEMGFVPRVTLTEMRNWPANAYVLVTLIVMLLLTGQVIAQPADEALAQLLKAAREDDTEAYVQARGQALALPDEQFAGLLKELSEIDTWQAIAMRDGLKLRREEPEVAKDFDERMREIVANVQLNITGEPNYFGLHRGLKATAEHDILRFEALLAWKCRHERRGRYDALRWLLFAFHAQDETSMKRNVLMLQDRPIWLNAVVVPSMIYELSRQAALVDPHVPVIVEQYRKLRQEPEPQSMSAARMLVLAVAGASPDKKRPALQEIELFERAAMARQGLEPWNDDRDTLSKQEMSEREALVRMREALGKAPEDAGIRTQIAAQEEQLEKVRLRVYAWSLWSSLEQVMKESEPKIVP